MVCTLLLLAPASEIFAIMLVDITLIVIHCNSASIDGVVFVVVGRVGLQGRLQLGAKERSRVEFVDQVTHFESNLCGDR